MVVGLCVVVVMADDAGVAADSKADIGIAQGGDYSDADKTRWMMMLQW